MKYEIIGDNDCPIAKVFLNKDEKCKIQRGSMVYMRDVDIVGKMNSKQSGIGGVLSAIGRSIAGGESIFMTHAIGQKDNSEIGIATSVPGKIFELNIGEKQYRLNDGAFLACDDTVDYTIKTQKFMQAICGGSGGLFVMETEGRGTMLISAFGSIVNIEVEPGKPLIVDNDHVLAWDRELEYNIEIASGTFGFTTGEGLVNKFTGRGNVLIQTRNLKDLADGLSGYIKVKS